MGSNGAVTINHIEKVSHDGAHAVPHNGGCIITNTEEENPKKETDNNNNKDTRAITWQLQEHAHNRFESYIHDTPL